MVIESLNSPGIFSFRSFPCIVLNCFVRDGKQSIQIHPSWEYDKKGMFQYLDVFLPARSHERCRTCLCVRCAASVFLCTVPELPNVVEWGVNLLTEWQDLQWSDRWNRREKQCCCPVCCFTVFLSSVLSVVVDPKDASLVDAVKTVAVTKACVSFLHLLIPCSLPSIALSLPPHHAKVCCHVLCQQQVGACSWALLVNGPVLWSDCALLHGGAVAHKMLPLSVDELLTWLT